MDDLTVNLDCDLDFLDSAVSGELTLDNAMPLSSTSPIEEDVMLSDIWDAFFDSWREELSVDSGEPPC